MADLLSSLGVGGQDVYNVIGVKELSAAGQMECQLYGTGTTGAGGYGTAVARKLSWSEAGDTASEMSEPVAAPQSFDLLNVDTPFVPARKSFQAPPSTAHCRPPDAQLQTILKKLQRDLHRALATLDLPASTLLNPSQLKRVLQEMHIFRAPPVSGRRPPTREDHVEEQMLSRLFSSLAINSMTEKRAGLDVTTLYNFLCAVLELSRCSDTEFEATPTADSGVQGESGAESGVEGAGVEAPLGNVQALALEYSRKFTLNHLARKLQRAPRQTVDAPPFKPQVSDQTSIMAEKHRARIIASSKTQEAAYKLPQATYMYGKDPHTILKIEQSRTEQREKEMADCTFVPQINHKTHQPSRRRSTTQRICQYSTSEVSQMQELVHCTFQPQINKSKRVSTALSSAKLQGTHRGEQECVERLRRAQKERETRQKALDIRCVSPNRPRPSQPQTARPFNLAKSTPVQKRQPVMYLDVQLKGGRKGRIGVCHGDNPYTLASNFARTYNLQDETCQQVEELIRSHLMPLQ